MSPRRDHITAIRALALCLAVGAVTARALPARGQNRDHDNPVRDVPMVASYTREDALEAGLAGLVAMAFAAIVAVRVLQRGNDPPR